jgi:hypothetical protein
VATEASLIEKIRRAVADFEEPIEFEKVYYQDALEFALSKLNNDFGLTFATVSAVTANKLFLLEKLATIQMAYARAAKILDRQNDPDTDTDDIASLQVPDLMVTGAAASIAREAKSWFDLAEMLQAGYDGELENAGGTSQTATVQVATIHRISLRHGGYRNRILDPGLDAVTVAATVVGTTVTLEWDTLYASDFWSYEVYRGTQSDMSDEERIYTITDNHDTDYDDEDLVSGTYYYRIKTVNPNELRTNSNTVEAIV